VAAAAGSVGQPHAVVAAGKADLLRGCGHGKPTILR
jgi:hypothetical protein